MSTLSRKNSDSQQIQQAEQVLYDYLLACVQTESPERLLEEFRSLFVHGQGCRDSRVYSALEIIVKSKGAEARFNLFFNRCCYILINRWQMNSQSQSAIPELVRMFDYLGPAINGYPTTANLLRRLVRNFTQDELYVKMQRLARIIDAKQSSTNNPTSSVGNLIHRYPYLYNHCLLGDNSNGEDLKTVHRIKTQIERRFEVDLSKYATYQVRLTRMAQGSDLSTIIRPVKNPTLLSDRELNRAIIHYTGAVQGNHTYKDISRSFISHSANTFTYRAFKNDLYHYIASSFDSKYAKSQFNKKLCQHLQNTLPEFDNQRPSEFLIVRTSSQLFNFLVVESAHQPQHYVFVDLITNMGVTRTIGLLLKVVLMCNKVKPYLEKRFSILFNHYESFAKDGVPWLVKALESLQVAFSVHFGKADVSCFKQLRD
ncbi:hypothetical protein Ple7327_4199 [Pleurocapsa sp. PCC 7327]|uniref:hypothetical protein n=1 Tax=Pleurocapsa sp. PCC 7327 TaxID=118163 RepID=UPI00029FE3F8|nr:hypothetical protein [Pleurocapsa sp. PCC 7327]AFY79329.1 hypothetical protein Ple7327_4199 [Pleurocapsa sp. PCC 7327]